MLCLPELLNNEPRFYYNTNCHGNNSSISYNLLGDFQGNFPGQPSIMTP